LVGDDIYSGFLKELVFNMAELPVVLCVTFCLNCVGIPRMTI